MKHKNFLIIKQRPTKYYILTLLCFSMLVACIPIRPVSSCPINPSHLMPSNEVPRGSQLKRAAYSGNMLEGIDYLTIRTNLSVSDLSEHYNTQTEDDRKDWILLNAQSESSFAWSTWSIIDMCGERWEGTIVITQHSENSNPFVAIRVTKVTIQ